MSITAFKNKASYRRNSLLKEILRVQADSIFSEAATGCVLQKGVLKYYTRMFSCEIFNMLEFFFLFQKISLKLTWNFRKKIVVSVEDNTQLLENFPHVGDMLLCLYKCLYNLNTLEKDISINRITKLKTQTVITKYCKWVRQ